MRFFAPAVASVFLIVSPSAGADELDEPVRIALREALEARAPVPSDAPRLLDPSSSTRQAPDREAPDRPGSEAALAAGEATMRAVTDKAVEGAAALAQEAIGDSGATGTAAATRAADADREGEAAVGASRAAQARGVAVPLPLNPVSPVPRTPSTQPLQTGGQVAR